MFHDTACLRSCFAGSFVAVKRFFGTWLHACQPGVQCKVYNNYIQPVEINSCHTICQYMRHKKKENSNLIVKDPKYHCLNLRSLCFVTSGVRSVRHVFAIRPSKKKRWHLCQHLERGSRQQSSDCFLSGSETGGHHGPLLQQYDSIIFIPNFSLLVLGKHG